MASKLLTITEAAVRLRLREATIRRWVFLRKMNYVKAGSAVRIPESEVERIIAEGTVKKLS